MLKVLYLCSCSRAEAASKHKVSHCAAELQPGKRKHRRWLSGPCPVDPQWIPGGPPQPRGPQAHPSDAITAQAVALVTEGIWMSAPIQKRPHHLSGGQDHHGVPDSV